MAKLIDRTFFFDEIKKQGLFTKLTQSQVDGMNGKLDVAERLEVGVLEYIAYVMATSYHETGKAMAPVREVGKGKGRDYGKKLKMGGGPGKRVPYTTPDQIYYGRGDVQLTWYENYQLMSRLLFGDLRLLIEPDLALDSKVSAMIIWEGMLRASSSFGDFTGRCLEQYYKDGKFDWFNARKIVNGLDKAQHIGDIGRLFLKCIRFI